MRQARDHARHFLRAAKHLVRSNELPRWVKALLLIGLLPIPGPFDEAVLIVAAALLWFRHRPAVIDAWRETSRHN